MQVAQRLRQGCLTARLHRLPATPSCGPKRRTCRATSGAVRAPAAPEVSPCLAPRSPFRSLLAALGLPLARARPLEQRGHSCSVVVNLPQPLAIRLLLSLVAG